MSALHCASLGYAGWRAAANGSDPVLRSKLTSAEHIVINPALARDSGTLDVIRSMTTARLYGSLDSSGCQGVLHPENAFWQDYCAGMSDEGFYYPGKPPLGDWPYPAYAPRPKVSEAHVAIIATLLAGSGIGVYCDNSFSEYPPRYVERFAQLWEARHPAPDPRLALRSAWRAYDDHYMRLLAAAIGPDNVLANVGSHMPVSKEVPRACFEMRNGGPSIRDVATYATTVARAPIGWYSPGIAGLLISGEGYPQ